MTPQRIQRRRTRGWRKPKAAIIVTRPGPYGNPFVVGVDGTAAECVKAFSEMMDEWMLADPYGFEEFIAPLRGHDLCCWCRIGEPCHADTLLRIANGDRK